MIRSVLLLISMIFPVLPAEESLLPLVGEELLLPLAPMVRTSFQGQYEGHACPDCGRYEWVQSDTRGPIPGSHWHSCPCGARWWHTPGARTRNP